MALIKANFETAQLQKTGWEATDTDLDGQVQRFNPNGPS